MNENTDHSMGDSTPADVAQTNKKPSKFLVRVSSAVIYSVATLVCLLLGCWTTTLLLCFFAYQCCSEFYRMMRMAGKMPNELLGLVASIAFPIVANFSYLYAGAVAFLLAFATGIWFVLTPRASIADVALTIFGPFYCSLLFTSIVKFRAVDPGVMGGVLTFVVMASVWLNDSFAYIFGSRFGKHKLAPKISPNKSWEGFFGGMLGSVVVWIFIASTGLLAMPLWLAVLTGAVSGALGVFGDLFESRVKRSVNVKDSGNIMPGHGGMLDRHDSMLFAIMAAAFILKIGGIL